MPESIVQLGLISHIGIVVEDCEEATAWWERVFGVGPFSTDVYELNRRATSGTRASPPRLA